MTLNCKWKDLSDDTELQMKKIKSRRWLLSCSALREQEACRCVHPGATKHQGESPSHQHDHTHDRKLAARHDDSDTAETVFPPPPPERNAHRPSPPSTPLGDIHTPMALTDLVEPPFRGKYSDVAIKTGAGPPSHPVPVALMGRLAPRTAAARLASLFFWAASLCTAS